MSGILNASLIKKIPSLLRKFLIIAAVFLALVMVAAGGYLYIRFLSPLMKTGRP